ncbi:MAG: hypothetical protein HC924_14290 [Synechococcaceae cyanobacterium SM2_3_2]|nr:hypothetical protein [Synechococcaceae cyanobacterium SM2_3_2]
MTAANSQGDPDTNTFLETKKCLIGLILPQAPTTTPILMMVICFIASRMGIGIRLRTT